MAEPKKYELTGQTCQLNDMVTTVTGRAKYKPATPGMIVASLDAKKRVDECLVTHV